MNKLIRRTRNLYYLGKRILLDRSFRIAAYQALHRLDDPTREHLSKLETIYSSPLPIDMTAAEEARFVVVLPSLKMEHVFGGAATALKLAALLANQGLLIRVSTIDQALEGACEEYLWTHLKTHLGLTQQSARNIELTSIANPTFPGHPQDIFLATTWWSARRIAITIQDREFKSSRFYYLIQDFEPGFYAWSDEYALAVETYKLNCVPLVNSSFLANHLTKDTGIKVDACHVFRPEIDWGLFSPASTAEIQRRQKRRIFLYGRPSVSRNLFGIAVAGLRRFIEGDGITAEQLEVVSAGEAHATIDLGSGIHLHSIGKLPLVDYAKELRSCDVGLSLMLSPHPSYPPFEMAASGLTVVTCDFSGKHMDLGENFVAAEPTPEGIAHGLSFAYRRSSDADARVVGAKFDLSKLGRRLEDVAADVAASVRKEFQ